MNRAHRAIAALALSAALVAAGCGDDDDDTSAATTGGGTEAAGPPIQFRPLDAGGPLTVAALESGEIDIAVMFSSQGIIAANDWVVLEDDKGLQPVENLVPAIRTEVLTDDIATVLNEVSAALTTEELAQLNLRVDEDLEDPEAVAADWLAEEGLDEGGDPELSGSITIGSANFSESTIVASIYAAALEAHGMSVSTRFNLGSREVSQPALEGGDIDLIPEYVGSYLTFLGGEPTGDLDSTLEELRAAAEEVGVSVLEPAPAEDKNALVVTRETADEFGLETTSDLLEVTEQLVLGGPPECPERPYCILGWQEVYGLRFDV